MYARRKDAIISQYPIALSAIQPRNVRTIILAPKTYALWEDVYIFQYLVAKHVPPMNNVKIIIPAQQTVA